MMTTILIILGIYAVIATILCIIFYQDNNEIKTDIKEAEFNLYLNSVRIQKIDAELKETQSSVAVLKQKLAQAQNDSKYWEDLHDKACKTINQINDNHTEYKQTQEDVLRDLTNKIRYKDAELEKLGEDIAGLVKENQNLKSLDALEKPSKSNTRKKPLKK